MIHVKLQSSNLLLLVLLTNMRVGDPLVQQTKSTTQKEQHLLG